MNINNKQLLIAISGKANSGKNTLASMITDATNFPKELTKTVALADPMKRIVKTIFPEASNEALYGPSELRSTLIPGEYKDKNSNQLTHRQALIDLGAFGRQYNSNIWLNLLVNDAKTTNNKLYIVSDVRFINEYEYLKNAGFIMIRVIRNNIVKINDPSEIEQDKIPNSGFHFIIENSSSLKHLNELVYDIVPSLIGTS